MLKEERHNTIVEMCRARGTVTVREIADILGVSDMTVRRDLMELSDEGRIVRFRGGAKTAENAFGRSLICEPSHLERQLLHIEEKTHIAEIAATQVSEGDTIFLGSSTTVELAAQNLPAVPLRIVTNSLPIFNLFADGDIREVTLIGGTYRYHSGTFMGPLAESALESLGFDKAFIGVNGIQDGSLYTSYFDAGRLYQIAFEGGRALRPRRLEQDGHARLLLLLRPAPRGHRRHRPGGGARAARVPAGELPRAAVALAAAARPVPTFLLFSFQNVRSCSKFDVSVCSYRTFSREGTASMRIVIGSDAEGMSLKETIKAYLIELGHEVVDKSEEPAADFVDSTLAVAHDLLENPDSLGFAFDLYGDGSYMAACKVKGMVACECSDERSAFMTRQHNNARLITMGSAVVGDAIARGIVREFLSEPYAGGRHQIRVDMLNKMA